MLTVAPHPLLDLKAFVTVFPAALGSLTSPPALTALFTPGAAAPMASSDELRRHIRDLLRHGGFKPTGRSKPASEYLIKAAEGGFLGAINPAVDTCNAVSLHSGLPISVVDLSKARAPLSVDVAPTGATYVFNAAGKTIDLDGLLCLFDGEGPCANAVKDCQRTKTDEATTRTLTAIWGSRAAPGRAEEAMGWYRALLADHFGATTEQVG